MIILVWCILILIVLLRGIIKRLYYLIRSLFIKTHVPKHTFKRMYYIWRNTLRHSIAVESLLHLESESGDLLEFTDNGQTDISEEYQKRLAAYRKELNTEEKKYYRTL